MSVYAKAHDKLFPWMGKQHHYASCKFKFILCKCCLKPTILFGTAYFCLFPWSHCIYMQTWRNVLDYLNSFPYSCIFYPFKILTVIKNSLKLNFSLGDNFHMLLQQEWILLVHRLRKLQPSGSFFYQLLFRRKLLCSTVQAGKEKEAWYRFSLSFNLNISLKVGEEIAH